MFLFLPGPLSFWKLFSPAVWFLIYGPPLAKVQPLSLTWSLESSHGPITPKQERTPTPPLAIVLWLGMLINLVRRIFKVPQPLEEEWSWNQTVRGLSPAGTLRLCTQITQINFLRIDFVVQYCRGWLADHARSSYYTLFIRTTTTMINGWQHHC